MTPQTVFWNRGKNGTKNGKIAPFNVNTLVLIKVQWLYKMLAGPDIKFVRPSIKQIIKSLIEKLRFQS